MAIRFDEHTSVFHMETEQSSYQMKVDSRGMLLHLHYGKKIPDSTEYLIRYQDRGFSGNPYAFRTERGYSQDLLPQEYSGRGMGDYRVSALETVSHQGSRSVELFYLSHRIYSGRKPLEGLPYVRGGKEIETLEVVLRDPVLGLQVELVYHVFEKENVISRSVRVMNESQKPIRLEKAASFCLDFSFGTWDLIRFHGRHCMERQPERQPLPHGITSMGSRRGMSSHHANPFVILCEKHATERRGNC